MPIPKNVCREYFVHPIDQFFIQENIIDNGNLNLTPDFEGPVNFFYHSFDEQENFEIFNDTFNHSIGTPLYMAPEIFDDDSIDDFIIACANIANCNFIDFNLICYFGNLYIKEKYANQTRWQTDSHIIVKLNRSKLKYFKFTELGYFFNQTKVE